MKKIDDWKSIDPVVSTGRTPTTLLSLSSYTFETCSGALRYSTKGKERKINNIFHSFFILWTWQCEKTQIYSNVVIFFFVSRFFFLHYSFKSREDIEKCPNHLCRALVDNFYWLSMDRSLLLHSISDFLLMFSHLIPLQGWNLFLRRSWSIDIFSCCFRWK